MKEYEEKRDELTVLLQKIESMKCQASGKELIKLLNVKQNDLLKESDRIRKQFAKREINTDAFMKDFVQSRIQFHQIEAAKQKIQLAP